MTAGKAQGEPMNASDQSTDRAGAGEPLRRLTRSDSDKVLTGLAGGLGRHFGVDPVIFRIAFVVLSFVGGTGVLAYLAGWLLIPDESGASEADRLLKPKRRKLALWALAIIGVGMFLDGFDSHFGEFPFGLFLVGVGFAFLWSRRDGTGIRGGGPDGDGRPAGGGTTATGPKVTLAKHTMTDDTQTDHTQTGEVAPESPPPPAARKPRSVLLLVTLSVLAIAGGGMALLGVSPETGVAIALLITGVALVIGAWRGRARALIPVAILLALGLGVAAAVDVPLRGGTGERDYRPATVADVRTPYRLAIGELTLDLSGLAIDTGSSATPVVASVGVGHLVVIVPRSAEVVVTAHAGLGELDIDGRHWEGTDVDERITLDGVEGGGRIVLRAEVGIGQVEVRRASA